jgi:ATP-dependent DNA helicase RecQ
VALRQMARFYPETEADFARISGVGEKKLREFGGVFMAEITSHLRANPRQVFADDAFTSPTEMMRPRLTETVMETLHFFRQGRPVEEIARLRRLTEGTIYGHLAAAIEGGEAVDTNRLLTVEGQREIAAAFERHGWGNLSGAFEFLGGRYSHGQLRVYRATTHSAQARA